MKLLVTAFLLPPGIILVLALIALFYLKKKPNRAFILLVCAIVVGWLFSTIAFGRVVSTILIAQVEKPGTIISHQSDLIVALTGGMYFGGKDVGWLPSQETYRRTAVAFELQNTIGLRTPILISGGKTAGINHPSEAAAVYAYFDKHRAQITPVILEESATDTYENALQIAAIAQQRRTERVLLVTSEMHMPRALATFRGRGLNTVPYPVVIVPRGPLSLADFLPSPKGVMLTAKAFYEFFGIAEYAMMGRIKFADLSYSRGE